MASSPRPRRHLDGNCRLFSRRRSMKMRDAIQYRVGVPHRVPHSQTALAAHSIGQPSSRPQPPAAQLGRVQARPGRHAAPEFFKGSPAPIVHRVCERMRAFPDV